MTEPQTFRLGYKWELEGSIDRAFYFISHIATWPDWWPEIVKVETAEPDREEVRVGDKAQMTAKSFLPYGLDWETTVRRIERPNLIEVDSAVRLGRSYGLSGVVGFELQSTDGRITVTNRQEMVPDRPVRGWMLPLANWVFNFNHDFAMKRGQPGLQRLLRDGTQGAGPKL